VSKTCILVGNGGSLLGSSNGELIDSFESVVRFNEFQTHGYELDVGSKSTHWFTVLRASRSHWRSKIQWRQIWTHSWEARPSRCQTFQSYTDSNSAPCFKVPHSWLGQMSRAASTCYKSWSTGALAIWGMLHECNIEQVHAVGFDWWREPQPQHHYCDNVQRGSLHDPKEEKKLIDYLVAKGKLVLHE